MAIVYHYGKDGSFVAGDTETKLTRYSYPSSPNAVWAKTDPLRTARDMIRQETSWRGLPAGKHYPDYDKRNWERLTSVEAYDD